jgi:hypothetical protein
MGAAAAAGMAAVVCVAAWAMLVRGHDDANQTDSLITAPRAEPAADLAPAPEPLAMTAGAIDPGIDSHRAASSSSPRPALRATAQIKPHPLATISVPPADQLDHLTTFELIFPAAANAQQHPRPTDIAPDDLLGTPSTAPHSGPLSNH